MNWRRYLQQLKLEHLDDETRSRLRSLLYGKDLQNLDSPTQREMRAILRELERKKIWLNGKIDCPECGGEGLEVAGDIETAPIVKSGRGYMMRGSPHCHDMRYVAGQVPSGLVR